MSYAPDCADCPTPEDCKAKNDCQVLRQIRHGPRSCYHPDLDGPAEPVGVAMPSNDKPDESAEERRLRHRLEKIDALLDELAAPKSDDWDGLNVALSQVGRILRLVGKRRGEDGSLLSIAPSHVGQDSDVLKTAEELYELNRPLMDFLHSVPRGYQCHWEGHRFIPLRRYCEAAAWAIEQLSLARTHEGTGREILDTLDWERLRSGQHRALNPDNQPLFDKFFAPSSTGDRKTAGLQREADAECLRNLAKHAKSDTAREAHLYAADMVSKNTLVQSASGEKT